MNNKYLATIYQKRHSKAFSRLNDEQMSVLDYMIDENFSWIRINDPLTYIIIYALYTQTHKYICLLRFFLSLFDLTLSQQVQIFLNKCALSLLFTNDKQSVRKREKKKKSIYHFPIIIFENINGTFYKIYFMNIFFLIQNIQ